MEPAIRGHNSLGEQLFHAIEVSNGYGQTKWISSGRNENGLIVHYDIDNVISHYLIDHGSNLYDIEYTDQHNYVRKEPGTILPQTKAGLIAEAIRLAIGGGNAT